ncbi:DUF4230 domain-containing protein [Geodermatophilus sp. SYSU D00815]
MLLDRPIPATAAPRRRRPRGRRLVVGAAALAAAGFGLQTLVGWENPFAEEVVDRSTTPLLLALDDLHEYHAATGTFQVVVDLERDTPYLPSVISGERTSLLATGTVDAYVDLEDVGDAVELSADGRTATVVLPAPELAEPRLDPAESRVLDRDRGLVQRVGDALADDTTDDTALYAEAEERLASAAAASDLRERAEDNTRDMLTSLAEGLGVEELTVTFEADPA